MVTLRDKETSAVLGSISEEDLKLLVDAFEEENRNDRDYYVDKATIDLLEDQVAGSANVVTLLREALGNREGIDIVWSRD